MNVQTTGAFKRPKLSLPFDGRANSGAAAGERNTLPEHELRRIVAAMIG